jgi:hypothetical protein
MRKLEDSGKLDMLLAALMSHNIDPATVSHELADGIDS